jgi:lysophospholipase L1-like esterase
MSDDFQVQVIDAVTGKTISMYKPDAAFAVQHYGTRYSYGMSPEEIASHPIVAWGDSLTNAQQYNSYPAQLSTLLKKTVLGEGITTETSTQILARMLLRTDLYSATAIIWAGRNDYSTPTTVEANIASMVAALGHNRYVILSVLNGSGEVKGSAGYGQIISINTYLAALYPNNYIDVRALLVAAYNPLDGQDVTDHGNDVPPASLRVPADPVHLISAGYAIVANAVYTRLNIGTQNNIYSILGANGVYLSDSVYLNNNGLTPQDNAVNIVAIGGGALSNNTTGIDNIAVGRYALIYNTTGSDNIAFGYRALRHNIVGSENVAIGTQALEWATGSNNIAIGYLSQSLTTTGHDNTSFGNAALQFNTTGFQNVAIGSGALYGNTTANYNTAIGMNSLYSNTDGDHHTAIGFDAMLYSNHGVGTTAIGYASLENVTGNFNTGVGGAIFPDLTSGVNNSGLGKGTGAGIITGSNNTILGALVTGLAAGLAGAVVLASGDGAIKADYNSTTAGVWTFAHTMKAAASYTIAQLLALSGPVDGQIAYCADTLCVGAPTWHAAVAAAGSTTVSGYVYYSGATSSWLWM